MRRFEPPKRLPVRGGRAAVGHNAEVIRDHASPFPRVAQLVFDAGTYLLSVSVAYTVLTLCVLCLHSWLD